MQTPKQRNSPSEAPRKISPRAISSEVPSLKISPRANSSELPQKLSPRVVRQLKTTSQESVSASSSSRASRTPRDRSSKADERKSPVPEKKQPNRVAQLEVQISQLQNDLKKVTGQLESSEAWKEKAMQDAEESKKHLLEVSLKLEVSKQSGPDEVNTIEHRKGFEDQSLTLQSELEAFKDQHSSDSAALASAVNEIKELKVQLEIVSESEAVQTKNAEIAQSEVNSLKEDLSETLVLVEDMKNHLRECKESEAQAQGLACETLMQLETAKRTVETLRSDAVKTVGAYDAIALELEKSRARVNLLETLVSELKADINSNGRETEELGNSIEAEVTSLRSEVAQLRYALEAAEIRYKEEKTQNALQLKSAYELVDEIKPSYIARESKLESELNRSRAEIEGLRANLMDKETELQGICEENESLNMKLDNTIPERKELEFEKEIQKAKADIEHLKANLMDKEAEVQNILEENEILKMKIKKKETNKGEVSNEIFNELEAAKAAEGEANMKLGYMTEKVDKSNRKVVRVSEQLEAAQNANSEMEAELRRVKVQSDQWRKAAEAATSMISTGNNGKLTDGRRGSMENKFSPRSGRITPPYSEDGDDDFLKKKTPNVLKKIGVLWKRPQK